jgi:hypothetical protein
MCCSLVFPRDYRKMRLKRCSDLYSRWDCEWDLASDSVCSDSACSDDSDPDSSSSDSSCSDSSGSDASCSDASCSDSSCSDDSDPGSLLPKRFSSKSRSIQCVDSCAKRARNSALGGDEKDEKKTRHSIVSGHSPPHLGHVPQSGFSTV